VTHGCRTKGHRPLLIVDSHNTDGQTGGVHHRRRRSEQAIEV